MFLACPFRNEYFAFIALNKLKRLRVLYSYSILVYLQVRVVFDLVDLGKGYLLVHVLKIYDDLEGKFFWRCVEGVCEFCDLIGRHSRWCDVL